MTLSLPIRRTQRPALHRHSGPALLAINSTSAPSLSDVHNLIYLTNISIGGVSMPVQIDTGSSDLVTFSNAKSPPDTEAISTSVNITYGFGWASGHVAFASADFAGIAVPRQAYLNATSAQNLAMSYGATGVMGLGFNSLSQIDAAINQTGSSSGRALLYNLFRDNPSEPNFIAFSLQRDSDGDGVLGSLTVGETDPSYTNVTNTNKISTWPVTAPSRWNVLLDCFIVGTQTIAVSTKVPAAPPNKAVVLLDTGTSYTYAPPDVCTAIYGGISGARYDSTLCQWIVPCDVEIDMALQIDNQVFPIHPLDVTPTSLGDPNTCVGSFIPQSVSVASGQFDWLIGDNVLRSTYTLYDFGDFNSSGKMGNPYVQMLALVDPVQASIEFHNVRGGIPNTNITYNVSNAESGSTTVTLSTDVATALGNLSRVLPAILAVMALNALVLIVLVVVGFILLCRRRGKNVRARKIPGRLSPMPMESLSGARDSELPRNLPHTYQPVSLALTEDTLFVPPTPGFRKESLSSASRPNSIA